MDEFAGIKRLNDKLLIDTKTMNLYRFLMFENTKKIIKLKQITDEENEEITLTEYEYDKAKKNLKNYLEKIMSDTLEHIEYMYVSIKYDIIANPF